MKTKHITIILIILVARLSVTAQTNDDILNTLIQKNVLPQAVVDSLRADAAIKEQEKPKDKSFTVGAELRTRTEYRNGYRNLIPGGDTITPAFFTTQRTRLALTYEQKNKFLLHTSFQDVRVWGDHDPRSNAATLQLFEGYGELFLSPKWSVKLGRQKIALDNQRLFAENDWRGNANAHDALKIGYAGDKLTNEFYFAYNQTSSNNGIIHQAGGEPVFNTTYNPGFTNYKTLGVHYLKYKANEVFSLTTINAADGYQQAKSREGVQQRFTNGGRIEFEKGNWYVTASGYYQWGKNTKLQTIDAWYVQPEVKYAIPQNLTIRLGAEVMSGNDGEKPSALDRNFVALYGVAHRFNGSLDFFTSFPGDLNNAGLTNPYLFVIKNLGKKFELRSDFHLFYSQNNFVNKVKVGGVITNTTIDKYLGFENDWLLSYKPNSFTKVDLGFSWANPTKSMSIIKKGGNPDYTPTWAYVQVTFKPQLFKSTFN